MSHTLVWYPQDCTRMISQYPHFSQKRRVYLLPLQAWAQMESLIRSRWYLYFCSYLSRNTPVSHVSDVRYIFSFLLHRRWVSVRTYNMDISDDKMGCGYRNSRVDFSIFRIYRTQENTTFNNWQYLFLQNKIDILALSVILRIPIRYHPVRVLTPSPQWWWRLS